MKKRVRVISYAWGDKYVDDFLDIALAALLAPGNLPYLAERFDVELVFLTQERQFERIRATSSWQHLETVCRTKLVALDDLIVGHWYGISLSKALVRGFTDLGEAMLETYLIFLNADFIIADGSYRSIAEKIGANERLIFAPSYCVIRESVLPKLEQRRSGDVIAISPRDMAAIGIPERHFTIRAKTANQKLFRIHRYDHFYWCVDEQTLLARQMPIALVCMRPERMLTDIHTFWDYGVVSEFCPTARHCVLGDSDDYLMIELRDESTFAELMGLGWPTIDEIAKDLSSFTTKDQRDHLAHELVWHASDLPPAITTARQEFGDLIDDVTKRLSPVPVSYLNHQFWDAAIHRFEQLRADFLANKEVGASVVDNAAVTAADNVAATAADNVTTTAADDVPTAAPLPIAPSRHARLRTELDRLSQHIFGRVPFVHKLHPYWADLRHASRALTEKMPLEQARVLLVGSAAGLFERVIVVANGHAKVSPAYLLERGTTETTLEGDLHVRIEDARGSAQELTARRVTVVNRKASRSNAADGGAWKSEGPFDLCICELRPDDLICFREIFDLIRPQMRRGGRVIAVCIGHKRHGEFLDAGKIIRSGLPLVGRSEILYAGTAGSAFSRRLLARSTAFRERLGAAGMLMFASAAALAVAASWASARSVERQNSYKFGKHTTSFTMVIDLP
jgi:hypothetical protein